MTMTILASRLNNSFHAQLSMKFILLINVKMPTIVGILRFVSRINTSDSFKQEISCSVELSMIFFFLRALTGKFWLSIRMFDNAMILFQILTFNIRFSFS